VADRPIPIPPDPFKPAGGGLLLSGPDPLDTEIGRVAGNLPDGTEYRTASGQPAPGSTHVTPDGRTWIAVREQVADGKVVPTPNAIQWKCLPEDFADLLARLMALLRRLLAGLGAAAPLPAGTVGPEIPIDPGSFTRLFVSAATQAGGAAAGSTGTVVWQLGGHELEVAVGQVQVKLDDGLIAVSIPVSCDQVKAAVVQVPFAIGSKTAPAGLIAATEQTPRGPDMIVRVWGEALVAFAWQTLLTVLTRIAGRAGVDADGAGLIPAAINAGTDGVRILTQARQTFDRVPQ
jgi:hypothetical protein